LSKWRFSSGSATPERQWPGVPDRSARFQYDRDLTQRLTFRSAARYESQKQLQAGSGGDTEDTARLDLSLRWMLSRKWFVQGGYSYIWQQEAGRDDAYNNRFFLSGGYRGLARER
jgi:hypothetical protein